MKRIFEKYGFRSKSDKSKKVLYCSVYSNFIIDVGLHYKFSLRVDYIARRVYLLVFDRIGLFIEKESFWEFDVLREKLYNKMKVLAYIEAEKKYVNGYEYFRYDSISFFSLKGFDTFISLLDKGVIGVFFKVDGYIDDNLDLISSHGVSFCIKPKNLGLLYDLIC